MPVTIDAGTLEWISVDEVKRQANIKTSTSDEEVDLIRGAAQDLVEQLIGPVLWRTVTETVAASRDGVVALRNFPIVSLTSLTSSGTSVTSTLNSTGGMLTGITVYGDLTATYVAGRTSVPDAVRMAALIIAAHLWETQRGASPSPIPTDDFGSSQPFGVGFAIPNRAMELLSPYLLPPAVA